VYMWMGEWDLRLVKKPSVVVVKKLLGVAE
jgi:hypothetical protein